MRHPRSRCTFAFETMAYRKKQVWQPGGGPTGATCCGALLIILSAFLSFSFRLSLSLFAHLLCFFFLLLFLPSLHLRDFSPPSHILSLSLSLSPPPLSFSLSFFLSPSLFRAPGLADRSPLFRSLRRQCSACRPSFRRALFIVARPMSFKCLEARDVPSLSLVKGHSIKQTSTEMFHRVWCKAIKVDH